MRVETWRNHFIELLLRSDSGHEKICQTNLKYESEDKSFNITHFAGRHHQLAQTGTHRGATLTSPAIGPGGTTIVCKRRMTKVQCGGRELACGGPQRDSR